MIQYSLSDSLCLLHLNAPPLNTITFALLEALRAAICRANADAGVRGIVITGDADHFSAGADVNLFREIAGSEDAIRTSRVFQEAFQEVEDSAKPVAAAVAGRMMGSALELAMACHFRICAEGTKFNMPEVDLGINPGAGGTQRLPRLIGAGPALEMLLTAKPLDARRALDLDLVDAVCPGDRLIEAARGLLLPDAEIRRTSQRNEKIQDAATNAAVFEEASGILAGMRPEIIAPRMIVEAVRTGLDVSFQAGLSKEQEVFARCMDTRATQNKIYLFFATRQTGKVIGLGDTEPATVAKAGVIGAGSMGTGIAQALILGGVPVVVHDENPAAVEKALAKIGGSLQKRVDQGKLAPKRAEEMLGLISPAEKWQDLADADLVVEAVFEDVPVKRAVIAALEEACSAETVIATNTSTISLDRLAEGMRHGGRLIGMHFFNPAHRMPLVEIIRRDATTDRVVAATVQLARRLRKTPVLVKNREGFLVNRIFIPYLKEAFRLLEDGADARAIDRAMVEFGFPMGPLVLIDMAGLDILLLTDRVLSRAFPAHGQLSAIVVELVERGLLGQKTAAGVYRYRQGDYAPLDSRPTAETIAEVQRQQGLAPRKVGKDEITDRLVLRMVAEAFRVMEEGIAQRQSDLDVAMVLGTGFPDFRGGVLRYARDLGLDAVVTRLDRLTAKFGERFLPCGLLREM